MEFNASKCYVFRITQSRSPIQFSYSLNNYQLEETTSYAYLGVNISNDLSWNSHINNITAKANRSLGFICRNLFSCSQHVKDMAYKMLVRPILEYGSSVWDPHTQNLIKQVEAVQNRAARFVSGVNYKKCSITQVKKDLNWDDLATRRKVARLVNFHQAIRGHLAIPARNVLRPVQRSTRLTSPTTNNLTLHL